MLKLGNGAQAEHHGGGRAVLYCCATTTIASDSIEVLRFVQDCPFERVASFLLPKDQTFRVFDFVVVGEKGVSVLLASLAGGGGASLVLISTTTTNGSHGNGYAKAVLTSLEQINFEKWEFQLVEREASFKVIGHSSNRYMYWHVELLGDSLVVKSSVAKDSSNRIIGHFADTCMIWIVRESDTNKDQWDWLHVDDDAENSEKSGSSQKPYKWFEQPEADAVPAHNIDSIRFMDNGQTVAIFTTSKVEIWGRVSDCFSGGKASLIMIKRIHCAFPDGSKARVIWVNGEYEICIQKQGITGAGSYVSISSGDGFRSLFSSKVVYYDMIFADLFCLGSTQCICLLANGTVEVWSEAGKLVQSFESLKDGTTFTLSSTSDINQEIETTGSRVLKRALKKRIQIADAEFAKKKLQAEEHAKILESVESFFASSFNTLLAFESENDSEDGKISFRWPSEVPMLSSADGTFYPQPALSDQQRAVDVADVSDVCIVDGAWFHGPTSCFAVRVTFFQSPSTLPKRTIHIALRSGRTSQGNHNTAMFDDVAFAWATLHPDATTSETRVEVVVNWFSSSATATISETPISLLVAALPFRLSLVLEHGWVSLIESNEPEPPPEMFNVSSLGLLFRPEGHDVDPDIISQRGLDGFVRVQVSASDKVRMKATVEALRSSGQCGNNGLSLERDWTSVLPLARRLMDRLQAETTVAPNTDNNKSVSAAVANDSNEMMALLLSELKNEYIED